MAQAVLEAQGIWKVFDGRHVLRDISFVVEPGEILGLLGPNGAGKTTSIRICLGIIPPDRGKVRFLGKPLDKDCKDRVGYLPEERGLYRNISSIEILVYLGQLKGMSRHRARERAKELLERLGMATHARKKVGELSHGMAQLIQLAATLIHQPSLVVLDEPFASLDPVNLRLVKEIILEIRDQGTAVILSTHQMHQVEELCDRIVMINDGQVILSGSVSEIRRRFQGGDLRVVCTPCLGELEGVSEVKRQGRNLILRLLPGTEPTMILHQLLAQGCKIEQFQVEMPSLEDIFVRVVREGHG